MNSFIQALFMTKEFRSTLIYEFAAKAPGTLTKNNKIGYEQLCKVF